MDLGPPGNPGEWDFFSLRIEDQVAGNMVIIFFKYYSVTLLGNETIVKSLWF